MRKNTFLLALFYFLATFVSFISAEMKVFAEVSYKCVETGTINCGDRKPRVIVDSVPSSDGKTVPVCVKSKNSEQFYAMCGIICIIPDGYPKWVLKCPSTKGCYPDLPSVRATCEGTEYKWGSPYYKSYAECVLSLQNNPRGECGKKIDLASVEATVCGNDKKSDPSSALQANWYEVVCVSSTPPTPQF